RDGGWTGWMKNPSFRALCISISSLVGIAGGGPEIASPRRLADRGLVDRAVPSVSRRGPPRRRPLRQRYAEQLRFSCKARYHTRFRHTRVTAERLPFRPVRRRHSYGPTSNIQTSFCRY